MVEASSGTRQIACLAAVACTVSLGLCSQAHALEYQFSDGVTIQFQNTFQYSVLERTSPESPYLAAQVNANDGDNNLKAGIVSNRLDLLTKFDISDDGYGFARVPTVDGSSQCFAECIAATYGGLRRRKIGVQKNRNLRNRVTCRHESAHDEVKGMPDLAISGHGARVRDIELLSD